MEPVFVYLLECSDGTIYTGITKNLQQRMKQHASGRGSKYVKGRRPFRLVYYETHANRSMAMKREREIKSFSKFKKQQLIDGFTSQARPLAE
ncbi:MAG: GIY-YIG nuclease family protein [Methanobacteriota archaeon]|nr:MAG: GIY-YIG nuclease family protein [Euryarchaeota archaeon]